MSYVDVNEFERLYSNNNRFVANESHSLKKPFVVFVLEIIGNNCSMIHHSSMRNPQLDTAHAKRKEGAISQVPKVI